MRSAKVLRSPRGGAGAAARLLPAACPSWINGARLPWPWLPRRLALLQALQGTEFYDAPTRRYVDFPITDVLQVGLMHAGVRLPPCTEHA